MSHPYPIRASFPGHKSYTDRWTIDAYWRRHLVRAEALALGMIKRDPEPAPESWTWPEPIKRWKTGKGYVETGALDHRRVPIPQRPHQGGKCKLCGRSIFRLGWHRMKPGGENLNTRACWHAACSTAFLIWTKPYDLAAAHLFEIQEGRCAITGKPMRGVHAVDHRIPLYRVARDHAGEAWWDLLRFWTLENLQAVSLEGHRLKNREEAAERAAYRRGE